MPKRPPRATPLTSEIEDRRAAAIMFTDIEGFTETVERIGAAAAHRLLMTHNMIVRTRLTSCRGREVKTMGDGFLAIFPSAVQAVSCAKAIQEDLADHNATSWEQLKVRIGVHVGEVIRKRDDVHGRNVILAARIAQLARGGEVLVSGPVRAMASISTMAVRLSSRGSRTSSLSTRCFRGARG